MAALHQAGIKSQQAICGSASAWSEASRGLDAPCSLMCADCGALCCMPAGTKLRTTTCRACRACKMTQPKPAGCAIARTPAAPSAFRSPPQSSPGCPTACRSLSARLRCLASPAQAMVGQASSIAGISAAQHPLQNRTAAWRGLMTSCRQSTHGQGSAWDRGGTT